MISAIATVLLGVLATATGVELFEFTASWCGSCQQMKPTVSRVEQAGVPVRRLDYDSHRDLARQAGVDRLPTFLVVSDGKVLDRVVGATSYDRLMGMVSNAAERIESQQIASNPPPVVARPASAVVRGQQDERRRGMGNSLAGLMDRLRGDSGSPGPLPHPSGENPIPSVNQLAQAEIPSPQVVGSEMAAPASPAAAPVAAPVAKSGDPAPVQLAMCATVRLRVADQTGVSLGTGTIVDVHEDEALILTCGHIFEDSDGEGEILCDLVGGSGPKDLPGKLISYDIRRDVGLVSVRPGVKIEPIPIAGSGYRPRATDTIFTVGCSHGKEATVKHGKILAVNRYHGPANLVVSGRPVNGRSGGGLFNSQGALIGVCNAADQEEDEGLYAALGPIHAELDSSGLGFIYRPRQPSLATVPTKPRNAPAPSIDGSPRPRATLSNDKSNPPPNRLGAGGDDSLRSATWPTTPFQRNAVATSGTKADSGTEVICIVRPRDNDSASGQAFVLEQPSPELLDQLSQELGRRGPHSTTGAHQPANGPSDWQHAEAR